MNPAAPAILITILVGATVACVRSTPPGEPSDLRAELEAPSSVAAAGVIRIRFTNRLPDPTLGAVDLRADPGYWLRPVRQEMHLYRIPPDTTIVVEARYEFSKVSPGAMLHVRAGRPEQRAGGDLGIPEPVLVRSLSLSGTPEAGAFIARFDTLAAAHVTLYALRGGAAASALPGLAAQRESASAAIGRLLGVAVPSGIRMVFYPDSATKTTDTRHMGNGWASGSNIVEIYNDSTHVDPYHELTHLIAARLGGPPAWLDEGLATWASEHFGADALELLGFPGQPVRTAACRLDDQGKLVPASLLFSVPEFGGDSVPGDVAYAESAAMVKYLVERIGAAGFRELYRRLEAGVSAVPVEANQRNFEAVVGRPIPAFEQEFRQWLQSECNT